MRTHSEQISDGLWAKVTTGIASGNARIELLGRFWVWV